MSRPNIAFYLEMELRKEELQNGVQEITSLTESLRSQLAERVATWYCSPPQLHAHAHHISTHFTLWEKGEGERGKEESALLGSQFYVGSSCQQTWAKQRRGTQKSPPSTPPSARTTPK
jgi:hypothetical protein